MTREPLYPRRRAARGFTFTEILFAVIILGVGFIMLAAIFPVALSQTKQSADEALGAQAATSAAETIASVFEGSDWKLSNMGPFTAGSGSPLGTRNVDETLPATTLNATADPMGNAYSIGYQYPLVPAAVLAGQVHMLGVYPYTNANNITYAPGAALRLNELLASNSRVAWVMLYRRDMVLAYTNGVTKPAAGQYQSYYIPAPTAQIICIPVAIGVNSQFNGDPDPVNPASDLPTQQWQNTRVTPHNLDPVLFQATIQIDPTSSNFYITPVPIAAGGPENQPWTEGSYIVMADDKNPDAPGYYNGHIYRLGSLVSLNGGAGGNPQYSFMPGWEFKPEVTVSVKPPNPSRAQIPGKNGWTGTCFFYVVSRYVRNGQYIGPAQEVGAFSTTVKVQ